MRRLTPRASSLHQPLESTIQHADQESFLDNNSPSLGIIDNFTPHKPVTTHYPQYIERGLTTCPVRSARLSELSLSLNRSPKITSPLATGAKAVVQLSAALSLPSRSLHSCVQDIWNECSATECKMCRLYTVVVKPLYHPFRKFIETWARVSIRGPVHVIQTQKRCWRGPSIRSTRFSCKKLEWIFRSPSAWYMRL